MQIGENPGLSLDYWNEIYPSLRAYRLRKSCLDDSEFIFMPPTLKKLEKHIAAEAFVQRLSSFLVHSITLETSTLLL